MYRHLNKCVFVLVIAFIGLMVVLVYISMESNESPRVESDTTSEAKNVASIAKPGQNGQGIGSSSNIDTIYRNSSPAGNEVVEQKKPENKTVLKRMIFRQHIKERQSDSSSTTTANSVTGDKSSIASVPFEFRNFLLRKAKNTLSQQTTRPFFGFKSGITYDDNEEPNADQKSTPNKETAKDDNNIDKDMPFKPIREVIETKKVYQDHYSYTKEIPDRGKSPEQDNLIVNQVFIPKLFTVDNQKTMVVTPKGPKKEIKHREQPTYHGNHIVVSRQNVLTHHPIDRHPYHKNLGPAVHVKQNRNRLLDFDGHGLFSLYERKRPKFHTFGQKWRQSDRFNHLDRWNLMASQSAVRMRPSMAFNDHWKRSENDLNDQNMNTNQTNIER